MIDFMVGYVAGTAFSLFFAYLLIFRFLIDDIKSKAKHIEYIEKLQNSNYTEFNKLFSHHENLIKKIESTINDADDIYAVMLQENLSDLIIESYERHGVQ